MLKRKAPAYPVWVIGHSAELTPLVAARSAHEMSRWARSIAGPTIGMGMAGMKGERRPLWDIPDVARYVRDFALNLMIHDYSSTVMDRLDDGALTMLAMSRVWGSRPPFDVILDGKVVMARHRDEGEALH